MAVLPVMPAEPSSRETMRIGGGYGSAAAGISAAGGVDMDGAGNVAMDGDLTVDGEAVVGELLNVGGGIRLDGFLSVGTQGLAIITSEQITPDKSFVALKPETGVTDELWTINGGLEGDIMVVTSRTGDTVTVRDALGNIVLTGDYVMSGTWDTLVLIKRGTMWVELFRMNR